MQSSMYRYIAFIRNASHTHTNDVARRLIDRCRQIHSKWAFLDRDKGLSIFHLPPRGRSAEALELPGSSGVILGTLFPNDLRIPAGQPTPLIDERLAEQIVATRGRRLMSCFWGGYIALLSNREGTTHLVVRDCSGKIPCYSMACGDVTVVTSNINDLTGLSLGSFSINTRYLAGFFHAPELAQRECALNEVTEVMAGECLELDGTRAKRFTIWDPRVICREPMLEDFGSACNEVRRVTQACIDAWGSKYDRIVHMLSGGLDSSAVLGCLKRSRYAPQVTCLHLEPDGAGESEREFAQLAARDANVKLIVQPGYSPDSKYDERILRLPLAPKPSVANVGITIESDLRNRVPCQADAEATWDGQGGDHLFFECRSPFGAIDYAFRYGISGEFSGHVRAAIRRSGLSYWGVLGKALRLGLFGAEWQPEDQYDREASFFNPDLVPAEIAEYIWQPWLDHAADLSPGKRYQICLLASLIHRHRPVPELQYACEHHPFFSQPLIELCLKIPVYTLLRGGTDRALERAAFRDCVPAGIIRREGKGTVGITLMTKIRECLPFLRDLVLDGILVKQGIVERKSLEPFLAGNRPVRNRVFWPFLSCIAAEVWARKWADSGWRV